MRPLRRRIGESHPGIVLRRLCRAAVTTSGPDHHSGASLRKINGRIARSPEMCSQAFGGFNMLSNKNCHGSQEFFESTCAFIRDAALPLFISAFVVCAFPLWSSAQEIAPEPRPALYSMRFNCQSGWSSADGTMGPRRGVRQTNTHARDGPVPGLHCVEKCYERTACRSFAPPPGSDKFDTSRFFRCVDIAVTETDAGPTVIRMRGWVAPPERM